MALAWSAISSSASMAADCSAGKLPSSWILRLSGRSAGLALVIVELLTGTFYLLMLGVAAFGAALARLFRPCRSPAQIVVAAAGARRAGCYGVHVYRGEETPTADGVRSMPACPPASKTGSIRRRASRACAIAARAGMRESRASRGAASPARRCTCSPPMATRSESLRTVPPEAQADHHSKGRTPCLEARDRDRRSPAVGAYSCRRWREYWGWVLLIGVVVAFVIEGVRIVPQQSAWVVERLGKFHASLEPGLNLIIPFIDRVAYRHSLKEVPLDVPEQVCITKDNTQLAVDGIIYFQVTDPRLASLRHVQLRHRDHAARADHAAQRDRQDGARQDLRDARRDQPPDRRGRSTRPGATGASRCCATRSRA